MPTQLEQLAHLPPRLAGPSAMPCSSIGSAIWSPIRFTGLNAFIAPWKTIAMSFQRCGLTLSSPSDEDVLAVQEDPAGDARDRRAAAP